MRWLDGITDSMDMSESTLGVGDGKGGLACPVHGVAFAIIFSHSEGCLFTLLIVSFVVQKLLSLIRSHLFIFVFISNILGGGS